MKKTKTQKRLLKILAAITVSMSLFLILPAQEVLADNAPSQNGVTTNGTAPTDDENPNGEDNATDDDEDEDETPDADDEDEDEETPAADEDDDEDEDEEEETTPAVTPERTETQRMIGEAEEEALTRTFSVLNVMQSAINRLLWPILVMIGALIDNTLLFGGGMEEVLRSIWIPIRNLVNILFVIILVGIALYNVLGIGDENSEYAIKSILPKLVIGIIAVNFSFLAMKVMLDAINIATISIFSLPNQVSEGLGRVIRVDDEGNIHRDDLRRVLAFCAKELRISPEDYENLTKDKKEERMRIIAYQNALSRRNISGFLAASRDLNEMDNLIETLPEGEQNEVRQEIDNTTFVCHPTDITRTDITALETEIVTEEGRKFLSRWDHRNAAVALAMNMGNIAYFPSVIPESLEDLRTMTINAIISMAMYVVFVVSFVAMLIVLLGRIVVLWVSIALSPIVILVMSASGLKEKLPGNLSKITEIFTKNAIAPIMIAIPMTIGWIMLDAIQKTMSWSLDPTARRGEEAAGLGIQAGLPVEGLNSLQELMVGLGTIAVVWMGVFAATEGTIAQSITDKLKGAVEGGGKMLARIPYRYGRVIPITVGGETVKASAAELGEAVRQQRLSMRSFGDEKSRRVMETITGSGQLLTPEALTRGEVRTPTQLRNWFTEMERGGRLTSPETISAMQGFGREGNPDWATAQSGMDPGEIQLWEDLFDAEDAGAVRTAANNIRQSLTVGGDIEAPGSGSGTDTGTQAPPSQQMPVQVSGGDSTTNVNISSLQSNPEIENLIANAGDADIVGEILTGGIEHEGKSLQLTPAQLRNLVGDDAYDEILSHYGDDDTRRDERERLLAQALTRE